MSNNARAAVLYLGQAACWVAFWFALAWVIVGNGCP